MQGSIISGKTKLCGIIGDPIEHTLSPIMHNAAFRKLGIDYIYVPFKVKKEDLGKAIEGMRALNIKGLNVTIPHKIDVIRFLDELDPLAEKIGAVNTIVNNDGILKGYNTDALGFRQALSERGIKLKGKEVAVLGAGGASRAISFILLEDGANITILNRTLDRAKECANRIAQIYGKEIKVLELNSENLKRTIEMVDILVNATSVGMSPNIDETLVNASLISSSLIVFDVVYNPVNTKLLMEAKKAGAQVISGLEMFVWQGAFAFEKWTGIKAPVELMREEISKILK